MSYLTSVVESTILFFHSISDDWALAIFLLALALKLVLLPVHYVTYKQQRLLRSIQPQLDELSKMHAADPLTLYNKINTVKNKAGVKTIYSLLGSLVQLPIFFSIYRAFSTLPAFIHGNCAWITNLAAPDPLFILPAAVAVGTHIQQTLNPQSITVSKILKFMPVMSFIFMVSLPSGLVFYYAVSGALNILGEIWFKQRMIV